LQALQHSITFTRYPEWARECIRIGSKEFASAWKTLLSSDNFIYRFWRVNQLLPLYCEYPDISKADIYANDLKNSIEIFLELIDEMEQLKFVRIIAEIAGQSTANCFKDALTSIY